VWHNKAATRQPESKTISPVQPVALAHIEDGSASTTCKQAASPLGKW